MSQLNTLLAVSDYVDHLCAIEMRSSLLPQGTILKLYDEARRIQHAPLTYLAAQRLSQTIHPGDNVIITTGIGEPSKLPKGETDGPPGAAALARAISLILQANPIIVAGENYLEPVFASCRALGMKASDHAGPNCVKGESFPVNDQQARNGAVELLKKYNPSALISIECLGPNSEGVLHTLDGIDLTKHNVPLHHIFEAATQKSLLTIGLGDGGNEIGCGMIYEAVRRIQRYGTICQCPCKKGVATVTATDVLVFASTGNWGAYGVTASLALLHRNISAIHTPQDEEMSLQACVDAGARDGPTGSKELWVDSIPLETHKALLIMLRTLVSKYLE
ncbi:MAG TPA: glutamate cyclase domain-containing protein [Candidatus Bathyarchaeia archaeon]|nr:glutamate cyclase domain-containing protein [Candidatus Bathyarchaeia archaeon]